MIDRAASLLRWLSLALLAGSVALVPAAGAQTLPASDACVTCHLQQTDERLQAPALTYDTDIHGELGFGCLACHGGDGGSLDPSAGFLSAPERRSIPELCGRCHSDAAYMRQFDPGLRVDQVQEYWTSGHGIRLRSADDPDVATCTSCHPAHAIRPPDDPESTVHPTHVIETCGRCHSDESVMEGRTSGTGQAEEYRQSVHGLLLLEEGDLSAPVCNDCHGNHGAAPPGLTSVRNVCGQCHSVMADFYAESGHERIFEEVELPGCVTCHGNHDVQPVDDETLHARSEEVCLGCHDRDDPSGQAFEEMAAILDSLVEEEERSRALLEEAENLGMEVSQALFELEDVNNARTRAHSAIHTFSAELVREEVAAGLAITETAEERGSEALSEHRFRRVGLAVSSGIILLLVTGLLLRIREMDERLEALSSALESFFARSVRPGAGPVPTREELRLAACSILLEAAYADETLSAEEEDHLLELIRWHFGLLESEAEELIELANRERADPVDLGRFAAMIRDHFTEEQKRILLEELWALVYSDGELARHEVTFLDKVSKLLGMEADEVAEARLAVLGDFTDARNGH